ncbi:uncharacterized protein LOC144095486 [Amblyomma americanum]
MEACSIEASQATAELGAQKCAAKKTRGPRTHWPERETWALIRLWEDHLSELRGEKRNGPVYEAIATSLAEQGIAKTKEQVHSKIENLTTTVCRRWSRKHTGQGAIPWTFYWELHRFLGSLPVNDRSLVEESSCQPVSTVEEVIFLEEYESPSARMTSQHRRLCIVYFG